MLSPTQPDDTPAPAAPVSLNRKQRRAAEKAAKRKPPAKRFASSQEAFKPMALLSACRPYEAHELLTDFIRVRAAFERLKDGTADDEDFNRVAVAINLAKFRALDIDERLADMIEPGQDAMMRCLEREKKHGRYGFDGPGMLATAEAIDLSEQISLRSSPKQMEAAMEMHVKVLQQQVHERTIFMVHEESAHAR